MQSSVDISATQYMDIATSKLLFLSILFIIFGTFIVAPFANLNLIDLQDNQVIVSTHVSVTPHESLDKLSIERTEKT